MNMDKKELFRFIEEYIQENKPEGVHKLLLDISIPFLNDETVRIKPQYVVDKDTGLLDMMYKNNNKTDWHTKGDVVFDKFEAEMEKFLTKYLSVKVYFSGRGVTEKEHWYDTHKKYN
jgi:hypothetical protein